MTALYVNSGTVMSVMSIEVGVTTKPTMRDEVRKWQKKIGLPFCFQLHYKLDTTPGGKPKASVVSVTLKRNDADLLPDRWRAQCIMLDAVADEDHGGLGTIDGVGTRLNIFAYHDKYLGTGMVTIYRLDCNAAQIRKLAKYVKRVHGEDERVTSHANPFEVRIS